MGRIGCVTLVAYVTLIGCTADTSSDPAPAATAGLPISTTTAPSPVVDSSSAPSEWSGVIGAKEKRVRLAVPVTDAVRFEVNTGGLPIDMYAIAPSGDVITKGSPTSGYSEAGAQQIFWLEKPEPGTWTLVLRSPEHLQLVSASSIPVDVRENPIAVVHVTQTATNSVSVTPEGSYDPDGEIVGYLWSFGDGVYAETATAEHVYDQPGTYLITLEVIDEQGAAGFAWSDEIVVP